MSSEPVAIDTALAVLRMAREDRFDDIRELFAPQLQSLVTPEALRVGWEAEIATQGQVVSVGEPVTEQIQGLAVVKVPVICTAGGTTLVVSVTEGGNLAGLQLAPLEAAAKSSWEPPSYADQSTFTEKDVNVGEGDLSLKGTLTLPLGDGPHPGVVLLGGSGPVDRDETIGPNKPFKDLAWGLATLGVAVLRFDKVTFSHPNEVMDDDSFTLADEYLPAALDALATIRKHPDIDEGRVYLAGHSLGGTAAPLVAQSDPSVSGLIILAGGAAPLHWTIVRQFQYIASLNPETEAASEPTINVLTDQARLVDSTELSTSTPAGSLPLGAPAPYWLYLRTYDPVSSAASLEMPMLFIQGGRDYQATVADDLKLWRSRLAHRPRVTFRIYPADNHFLAPGSETSTPAEYLTLQHVDPEIISDISKWVKKNGQPS